MTKFPIIGNQRPRTFQRLEEMEKGKAVTRAQWDAGLINSEALIVTTDERGAYCVRQRRGIGATL